MERIVGVGVAVEASDDDDDEHDDDDDDDDDDELDDDDDDDEYDSCEEANGSPSRSIEMTTERFMTITSTPNENERSRSNATTERENKVVMTTPMTRAWDVALDALDADVELTEEAFFRAHFDRGTGTTDRESTSEIDCTSEIGQGETLYARDTDLEVAEEVDPRVGDALNELNDSMTECNALENEFNAAKRNRENVKRNARERLDRASAMMSTSVKTALPVFHKRALAQLYQVRSIEALRAYEDAHDAHVRAKRRNDELEGHLLASSGQVDIELMEACADAMREVAETAALKERAVAVHALNTRRAVEATTEAAGLEKDRRGAVKKAQPYFAAKSTGEIECAAADVAVAERKLAVRQAKARYDAALRALNEISEEIHARRAAEKLLRDGFDALLVVDVDRAPS